MGTIVVKPVTHVADVATKIESIVFIDCLLHIGNFNKIAPTIITSTKEIRSILVGPISFLIFVIRFIPFLSFLTVAL